MMKYAGAALTALWLVAFAALSAAQTVAAAPALSPVEVNYNMINDACAPNCKRNPGTSLSIAGVGYYMPVSGLWVDVYGSASGKIYLSTPRYITTVYMSVRATQQVNAPCQLCGHPIYATFGIRSDHTYGAPPNLGQEVSMMIVVNQTYSGWINIAVQGAAIEGMSLETDDPQGTPIGGTPAPPNLPGIPTATPYFADGCGIFNKCNLFPTPSPLPDIHVTPFGLVPNPRAFEISQANAVINVYRAGNRYGLIDALFFLVGLMIGIGAFVKLLKSIKGNQ